MRPFIPVFLLSLATLCSCAAPPRVSPHFSPPSVAPVREKVSEAQLHVTNAQTHADKAKSEITDAKKLAAVAGIGDASKPLQLALDAANSEIDALTQELTVTQVALQFTQKHVTALEGQIQTVTDGANTAIDQKNLAIAAQQKAEAQVKIDKAHAHRLKFYICSLAAALALFVVWKFKWILSFLGPYGLIAYAAVPAAVFTALWMFL
jgi:hypothetical protein